MCLEELVRETTSAMAKVGHELGDSFDDSLELLDGGILGEVGVGLRRSERFDIRLLQPLGLRGRAGKGKEQSGFGDDLTGTKLRRQIEVEPEPHEEQRRPAAHRLRSHHPGTRRSPGVGERIERAIQCEAGEGLDVRVGSRQQRVSARDRQVPVERQRLLGARGQFIAEADGERGRHRSETVACGAHGAAERADGFGNEALHIVV